MKMINKNLSAFMVGGKVLVIVFLIWISFAMVVGTVVNFAASGMPTSCGRSKVTGGDAMRQVN
jgi:pheromone shutdown protein TraB